MADAINIPNFHWKTIQDSLWGEYYILYGGKNALVMIMQDWKGFWKRHQVGYHCQIAPGGMQNLINEIIKEHGLKFSKVLESTELVMKIWFKRLYETA